MFLLLFFFLFVGHASTRPSCNTCLRGVEHVWIDFWFISPFSSFQQVLQKGVQLDWGMLFFFILMFSACYAQGGVSMGLQGNFPLNSPLLGVPTG